jgi:hypothetical protein
MHKILDESEPEFSDQFKSVLTLMTDLWNISDMWLDQESTPTRDKRFIRSAVNLTYQYTKKYGRSALTNKILEGIEGRVRIHDNFWVELLEDMALIAIESINSGQLKPYDTFNVFITPKKTPESLHVMTTIANAIDMEISQLYDLLF